MRGNRDSGSNLKLTLHWQPPERQLLRLGPVVCSTPSFLRRLKAVRFGFGKFHWKWTVEVGILQTCRSNRMGT